MILLDRPQQPAVLANNALSWKTEYLQALHALATKPEDQTLKKAKVAAEGKYRQSAVQRVLGNDMCFGKCAYCESKISHDQYAHIEHFRPKTAFPDLCFEWTNLLWACGMCNGAEFKGDKFPDSNQGGPIVDPSLEDPNTHLVFEYFDDTKISSVGFKTPRGKTTRDILGLNRPDLVEYRSSQVMKTVFIATKAAQGEPHAMEILLKACQKSSEYAAFSRAIADRFGIAWRDAA